MPLSHISLPESLQLARLPSREEIHNVAVYEVISSEHAGGTKFVLDYDEDVESHVNVHHLPALLNTEYLNLRHNVTIGTLDQVLRAADHWRAEFTSKGSSASVSTMSISDTLHLCLCTEYIRKLGSAAQTENPD